MLPQLLFIREKNNTEPFNVGVILNSDELRMEKCLTVGTPLLHL